MPKNKGKGGKNRRRGKNENENQKRELVFKEDGQEYAQVLKMLGNGRLEAHCMDGQKRLCHIRGKLRKKVWINTGDIILVGLRDYQDGKADVILKYHPDEGRNLKSYGELPDNITIEDKPQDQQGGDIIFQDQGSSDEEGEAPDGQAGGGATMSHSDLINISDDDSDTDYEEEAQQRAEIAAAHKKRSEKRMGDDEIAAI